MKNRRAWLKREIPLHVMILPGVIMLFIFNYIPLGGIIIAFQNFNPARGLFGDNPWIGLENFEYVFSLPNTGRVFMNTLIIAVLKIVIGTAVPIIVALLLNECRNVAAKRTIQTMIYFPYFISWIILSGVLVDILSPSDGLVNDVIKPLGESRSIFWETTNISRERWWCRMCGGTLATTAWCI